MTSHRQRTASAGARKRRDTVLWYNNPESVLAIQQAKRETVRTGRTNLRLVEDHQ